MNRVVATFIFIMSIGNVYSQIPDMDINIEELKNSDVILLKDSGQFTIEAIDKAYYQVFQKVVILNEDGNDYARVVLHYNDSKKIRSLDGKVYDLLGNELDKLKNSDIKDKSAFDGVSIYHDNRIKIADLRRNNYPYVVEYSYLVEYDNLFFIPNWYFGGNEGTYVLNSKYVVSAPPNLFPRYKSLNEVPEPKVDNENGRIVCEWEMNDIPSIEPEILSGDQALQYPSILYAPSEFEYGDIPGNMENWEEFGRWVYKVNQGRDSLSTSAKNKVLELTKGLNERDKIKALYQYMQEHTRYVSIQLGFGGYQPFPATYVEDNGYGDCKALTNYMYSLLKEAGIESFYTLVEAQSNPRELYDDFVYTPFNHAILAVPQAEDTVWLECTSQRQPFNFLGSFTADREVLMITPQGGKVVRTPRYESDKNTTTTFARVEIDVENNANVELKRSYKGLNTEINQLDNVIYSSKEEKQKWIYSSLEQSDLNINDFGIKYIPEEIPLIDIDVNFSMRSVGRKSGKRIFITPNLFNKSNLKLTKEDSRKQGLKLSKGLIEIDSIQLEMGNLYPESLPEPFSITSDFGSYEISVQNEQGTLNYVRKLIIKEGSYVPEKYNEFVDFVNKIYRYDRTRVVLVNKT